MKRHYAELWLLLLTAFVVFLLGAVIGMPEIAGHTFRSADITPLLSAKETDAQTSVRRDTVPAVLDETAEPCDTASHTILFIGDSMLEGLGPRLAAYAEENGHSIHTVIWYGSTTERWGSTDRLRSYIEKVEPTFIFICLGANELSIRNITAERAEYVKNIIADIGDIPYLWIGPPNWKADTGINELISEHTAPGTFFLSAGMEFERGADGAHPTYESAYLWMDSVARWMPLHSRHPIRLDKPSKVKAKATRIYMHKPKE